MGFLRELVSAVASAARDSASDAAENQIATKESANPKDARQCRSVVFSGDCERRVYSYYGKPLKRLRVGSTFTADVVTKRVRLVSDLTGGVWDTKDEGVALAYNGKVFGATSVLDSTFKELAELGYKIAVSCKMTGWYSDGIPEIVMMIDDPEEIFKWRDACKGLGREVPFEDRDSEECEAAASVERQRFRLSKACGRELPAGIDGEVLFFDDDKWLGKRSAKGRFRVDITTELIPPADGSAAKPHIAIVDNGKKVAEISARNRQYKMLAAHVGEHPYYSCCQKRDGYDVAPVWMVTVVYL